MLISVERLLIKLRQPASRADELVALRRRVRHELASEVDAEERQLARAVHASKLALATAVSAVRSCASCATHQPWPAGQYDGGACCSGVTAELFDDNELSALVHAGTRPRDLVPPPRSDAHAGCTFRGSRGCTLDLANRPARCVHYLCETLLGELYGRGDLDAIDAKRGELDRARLRFNAVHEARRDREVLAPLIEALSAATGIRKS